jgi:hypothetical protein
MEPTATIQLFEWPAALAALLALYVLFYALLRALFVPPVSGGDQRSHP